MYQLKESEHKAMFNMVGVGRKISLLRKEANLTQMELADKIDISFQAVSNWERGQTMPDISKLAELSEIFNVSIDEILQNDRASKISKAIINDSVEDENISVDELEEIAPILKPDQIDNVLKGIKSDISIDNISELAPFLSQEFIDEIAKEAFSGKGLRGIVSIAPFLSKELIDEGAKKVVEETNSLSEITCIVPFISKKVLDEIARKILEVKGIKDIVSVAPFLSKEFIDESAKKVVEETNSLSEITCIVPFMSDNSINELAMKALSTQGLSGLSSILPFIDSKLIEKHIKK